MARGKFITLEGIEGSGKSTCLDFISRYLEKQGIDLVLTREPGGTVLGERIRELLLDPQHQHDMHYLTELLLVFASRNQHLNQFILPKLNAGITVICSRFTESTYAYQGYGRGLDVKVISALENLVQGNLRPDLSIVLDVPSDVGMKRVLSRGGPLDRFEKEGTPFFDAVRHGFIKQAVVNTDRFRIIDSSRSLREVQENLVYILDSVFELV